jgi:hypothetical protein
LTGHLRHRGGKASKQKPVTTRGALGNDAWREGRSKFGAMARVSWMSGNGQELGDGG